MIEQLLPCGKKHEGILESRSPSLLDHYRSTIFPVEGQGSLLKKLQPVIEVIDQLPGELKHKQTVLTGLFWIRDADDFQTLQDELGLSEIEIGQHIHVFTDEGDPNHAPVNNLFAEFNMATSKKNREEFIEKLMLAGWINQDILAFASTSWTLVKRVRMRTQIQEAA